MAPGAPGGGAAPPPAGRSTAAAATAGAVSGNTAAASAARAGGARDAKRRPDSDAEAVDALNEEQVATEESGGVAAPSPDGDLTDTEGGAPSDERDEPAAQGSTPAPTTALPGVTRSPSVG